MYFDQSIPKLEENSQNTIIIVFCGDQISNALKKETLEEMGKNAILIPMNLKNCLREMNDNKQTESMQNLTSPTMVKISEMLCELGIPTNLLGYKYLRSAINIALTDRESLYGITKIIYPAVAKEFNSSSSRVERAIRHAIEVACTRGDIEAFRKIFGNTVSPDTGKPTNSELISKIADRLSMDDSFLDTVPNYV